MKKSFLAKFFILSLASSFGVPISAESSLFGINREWISIYRPTACDDIHQMENDYNPKKHIYWHDELLCRAFIDYRIRSKGVSSIGVENEKTEKHIFKTRFTVGKISSKLLDYRFVLFNCKDGTYKYPHTPGRFSVKGDSIWKPFDNNPVFKESSEFICNPTKQIKYLTKYLEYEPNNIKVQKQRAYLEYLIGDYSTLIEDSSPAIRGLIKIKKKDYQGALSDFNIAIRDLKKNGGRLSSYGAMYYYNRGVAYSMLGDHEAAISDYNQAINAYDRYEIAYAARSSSYKKLGNTEEACIDLKIAASLGYKNMPPWANQLCGLSVEKNSDIKEENSELRNELRDTPFEW